MRSALLILAAGFVALGAWGYTPEEIREHQRWASRTLHNNQAQLAIYSGDLSQLDDGFSNLNLATLSPEELRLLRNMIFARYGYAFGSEDLQDWLGKYDWYEPRSTDVNHRLTWVDDLNVERIRLFETGFTAVESETVEKAGLVGIWHASPVVAAGYVDMVWFFPDGGFRYAANQMDWGTRLRALEGRWQLQDNVLTIEVRSRTAILGGYVAEPYASAGGEFIIEGGTTVTITPDRYETLRFPVRFRKLAASESPTRQNEALLQMGFWSFWPFSKDPDSKIY